MVATMIEQDIRKAQEAVIPQKRRRGLSRLWHATQYSWAGLRAAVCESPAFRQELTLTVIGIPLAILLGRTWLETVVLSTVLVLMMIVELLNSGIECAIDHTSLELHPLAKMAKDFGSAAVFLSTLLCAVTWVTMLWVHFAQQF